MRRRILHFAVFVALALLGAVGLDGQSYTITPTPFQVVLDNAGAIVSGACVWTYQAGTTTPATTYSDTSGTTNTNPIIADSAGRYTAFLTPGQSYKFVYESACTPPAHGTTLRTADNIIAVPSNSAGVDVIGTAGEALSAGNAVYLSDGSGSKTAGDWYKADNTNTYSSTTNPVGMITAAIASGATGTIRIEGTVSGLTSLTIGLPYYISTSGAITSTAPSSNVRRLGTADTTSSLVLAPIMTMPWPGLWDLSASHAGQIKFPATQNPSTDPNTLDDYEEGSWTPGNSHVTLSSPVGTYVKIGKQVTAWFSVTWPTTADSNGADITGLPCTADASWRPMGFVAQTSLGTAVTLLGTNGGTFVNIFSFSATAQTNANMSTKTLFGAIQVYCAQ